MVRLLCAYAVFHSFLFFMGKLDLMVLVERKIVLTDVEDGGCVGWFDVDGFNELLITVWKNLRAEVVGNEDA